MARTRGNEMVHAVYGIICTALGYCMARDWKIAGIILAVLIIVIGYFMDKGIKQ